MPDYSGLGAITEAVLRIKEIQEELLAEGEKLQRLIVAGDSQGVGENVKRQNELVSALGSAERTRAAAVEKWAARQGTPAEGLTVSEIAKKAGAQARELAVAGEELAAVIERQRALNEHNKALLELHFEYMNFMIENFLEEPQLNSIYGSSGEIQEQSSINRIDGAI